MRQMRDSAWQRRGISWVWEPQVVADLCQPSEVLSLRAWLCMRTQWPDELPSGDGNLAVVAGLDGGLDLLSPTDGEAWLGAEVKETILSFQSEYAGSAALIFWLPEGRRRLQIRSASDEVFWRCAAPHSNEKLDFGRILWGEAREYPQELWPAGATAPVGLFHLRIT